MPSIDGAMGAVIAPASGGLLYRGSKRAVDVFGSSVALVALSPLLLAIGLAIRLQSPGPALFRQRRVGQGGKEFTCYKFRSMVNGCDESPHREAACKYLNGEIKATANDASGPLFKRPDDPRVTKVGRWLRRTSVDELPQLINVLKGEMSLVGPRPPIPYEVALYSERHWQRLAVPPGITCLWQIGDRDRVGFEEVVSMDLEYIKKRSLWTDMRILLLTIPAVLKMDGH